MPTATAQFLRCRCGKLHSEAGFDQTSRCVCGRLVWREHAGYADQTYADPGEAILAALNAAPGDRHVTIDPALADFVTHGYVLWSDTHDHRYLLARVGVRYEWQEIPE